MNVLEKILDEISEVEKEYVTGHKVLYALGATGMATEISGIIRSHMDEAISEMERIDKEKVTSAEIISRKVGEKTYYSIKYKTVGEDYYNIGYSSYKLDYVIAWLNKYFEFCGEAKVVSDNNGWIPVSEKLPEVGKMVKVTVHSSEWIADYDSDWVPEEEKTYHPEECNVYDGYIDRVGMWKFFGEVGSVYACDKEFGTDKETVYDVVTAWMPKEQIEPYKEV